MLVMWANSSCSLLPHASQYHWKPSIWPGSRFFSITRPTVFAGRRGECGTLRASESLAFEEEAAESRVNRQRSRESAEVGQ